MYKSVLDRKLEELAQSKDEAVAIQALTQLSQHKLEKEKHENRVGHLRDELKSLKKELAAARQQHQAAVQEAATLTARVAELEPQAARAPELQAALDTLNTERQAWETTKVEEITAESARQLRDAESARQRAELALATADSKYSQEALHHTMEVLQRIASSTPMPDFWTPEARKHSALFWQAWWTPERATLWTALENGFAHSPANFKLWAVRILHARLCGYCDKEPIVQLDGKHEYALAKADSLGNGMLEQIKAEAEQMRDDHLHRHKEQQHAAAVTYERRVAALGLGRTPLGGSEQESLSGLSAELHPQDCCCPVHAGIPRHLRSFEIQEKL